MPLTGLENKVLHSMPTKLSHLGVAGHDNGQAQLMSYLSQIQQNKSLASGMQPGLQSHLALSQGLHGQIPHAMGAPTGSAGILGNVPTSVKTPVMPGTIPSSALVGMPLTTPTSTAVSNMMQPAQLSALQGASLQGQGLPAGAPLPASRQAAMLNGFGKETLPSNNGVAMMVQQSQSMMMMPAPYQQSMVRGYGVPGMQ